MAYERRTRRGPAIVSRARGHAARQPPRGQRGARRPAASTTVAASTAAAITTARETTLRPARNVAKKVARKSARIAHELPSNELTSCAPEAKSLLMRTIFRVE